MCSVVIICALVKLASSLHCVCVFVFYYLCSAAAATAAAEAAPFITLLLVKIHKSILRAKKFDEQEKKYRMDLK